MLTIIIIAIGKRISRDSVFSIDIPIYLVLYGFVAPIWVISTLYKVVSNSEVHWR